MLIAATVITTALQVGIATPAAGFPRSGQPTSTCGSTVTYAFTNPDGLPGWDTQEKDDVELGVEGWESADDWDGTSVVTIYETTAAASEIDIYFESELAMTSINGIGECNDGDSDGVHHSIRLNPDTRNNSALLRTVARHEMGHVLGLRHTGRSDDYTNTSEGPLTIPTMATCLTPTVADDRIFGQDDATAVTHRLEDLSPDSIHANAGFEDWASGVPRYWGKSGGSWTQSSAGTEDGVYHVRYKPSTLDSSYVYQSINFAVGGASVDARVNYKKDVSTDSGSIRLELWRRQKSYGANPGCYWPTGLDQNSPSYPAGTAWVEAKDTGLVAVTSSWQLKDTTVYTPTSSWVAVDLQVRVKSTVKNSSGVLTYVRLDTVRARDRT